MNSFCPENNRRVILRALCLFVVLLAGCGGGGSSSGSAADSFVPVGSQLSVFNLRGKKPTVSVDNDELVLSNNELVLIGAAVGIDQDSAGVSSETGQANMSIFFGGAGFKDISGDVNVLGGTLDFIHLEALGTVDTKWARHLDAIGGAEDGFAADIETLRNSTVFQTNAGRLVLRNMDGAGGSGLSYATYGYWNAEFATFNQTVAFTLADPNANTTVPSQGNAVYQGSMTGLFSPGFGSAIQAAVGDASLTVDFEEKSVSGESPMLLPVQ